VPGTKLWNVLHCHPARSTMVHNNLRLTGKSSPPESAPQTRSLNNTRGAPPPKWHFKRCNWFAADEDFLPGSRHFLPARTTVSLSRAVFFHRLGEIRDRSIEDQRNRASGLTLLTEAIVLWNTVYLERTIAMLNNAANPPRSRPSETPLTPGLGAHQPHR
jgi:hypothetical protein